MESLWSALEAMPDRRTRKGRRYSLASIVTLSLAAMLAGANDLLAVHRFGRRLTPKSLAMLGIGHGKSPAHATLHYVFANIDAEELARALLGANEGGLGHVALDGKRLCGSAQEERPGVHLLSAFATQLRRSVGILPSRLVTLWPGATFIVRVERRRELRDRCQRQVIYAITSLPEERANAAALLELSRRHWAVENQLFHVWDRTLKEDECRVRSGTAPAALATIRDATLNIIRARKQKPRPAREAFAANPKAAIRAAIAS